MPCLCLLSDGKPYKSPRQGRFRDYGEVMKRMATSYVYHYNHKYDRVGHLFQERDGRGSQPIHWCRCSSHEVNIFRWRDLATSLSPMWSKQCHPVSGTAPSPAEASSLCSTWGWHRTTHPRTSHRRSVFHRPKSNKRYIPLRRNGKRVSPWRRGIWNLHRQYRLWEVPGLLTFVTVRWYLSCDPLSEDVLKFVKDLVDEKDEYKSIRARVNEVVNEDMSGNFSAKVLKIMGIEKWKK